MGVDTEALIFTTFDEFEYYLSPDIIIDKKRMSDGRLYAWTYYFDLGNGRGHSHVYNSVVDVAENESHKGMTKEEFRKYYDYIESLDYTSMDSINRYNEGIPDGTRGLKLDFGLYGKAPEFLQMLCYLFGGYFQYSDASGDDYIKIDKDYKKVIEWVFNEFK